MNTIHAHWDVQTIKFRQVVIYELNLREEDRVEEGADSRATNRWEGFHTDKI